MSDFPAMPADPNTRVTFVFLALASVGLVGVFGQAWILHNALVDSYPFKIMDIPSSLFYGNIGQAGYYVAVVSGILSILASLKLPRFLTSALPVTICPLAYWLVFEIAHVSAGFSFEQMREANFDGYTGTMARYEFGFEVLSLLFFGAITGLIAGIAITKLASPQRNKLP
ncbi:MAG: hypothetical protein ABI539_15730 [Acidobacteriota bacterium]